jgi:hypothetical protein
MSVNCVYYFAVNHVLVHEFIMSLNLLCIQDIHLVHMHAIGVPEGVTLLEFEGLNPGEHPAVEGRRSRHQKEESTTRSCLSALTTSPLFSSKASPGAF